ncbi:hypothetical protein [Gluconobacter albidus]|uniref:Uncharacterized protein n=1 Tax=Gluconobacter albidus TaxID=318683 RepID=A0AAW3R0M6_9PROT|nr:hypothetical protein [Gluconobacter albidus]KXV41803.1 hypothetical protein AD941_02505 [Gluconobacter albidus]GBQ90092.1 hypothetical protein AA3250_1970 [Gluconobacter albidus NBRC 3250]GLQ69161.1 hypothetical protein GCM10007866_16120 [Gluconobacter albidus]
MSKTERLKNEIREEAHTDRVKARVEERRQFSVDRALELFRQNDWCGGVDELIKAAQCIEIYLETGK